MSLKTDASAVLLPAIDNLLLTEQLADFLAEGGRTLLIGETRDEYVARTMSPSRQNGETAADLRRLIDRIVQISGPALIAVDQEPAGICRLHGLVPKLPGREELQAMTVDEIESAAFRMAVAAREMGITMFLAPVLDLVTGSNPWLDGRTLGDDAQQVAQIGAAYIRGVEAAGVVATAKHFPGHHDIDGDPATDIATVPGGANALAPGMIPFRAAIEAGARAMMTGPALVPGMDPHMPSSLSAPTVTALRGLGFAGLVVSDDLDAVGTLRGQRDVPTAAVEALAAGSDLLLLSAANDLTSIRDRILAAVSDGYLSRARLTEAAARVRALADSMR